MNAGVAMLWITTQTKDGRRDELDARLRSGAGTGRAHLSPDVRTYDGNWSWNAHRALCGTRIRAGDDIDVIGYHVSDTPPANACRHCLRRAAALNEQRELEV